MGHWEERGKGGEGGGGKKQGGEESLSRRNSGHLGKEKGVDELGWGKLPLESRVGGCRT